MSRFKTTRTYTRQTGEPLFKPLDEVVGGTADFIGNTFGSLLGGATESFFGIPRQWILVGAGAIASGVIISRLRG